LVVVELKSVEKFEPIFEAQLLTYLRLYRRWLDLLLNFNVPVLKDGILRRVRG
jgi:GxxExxY protein